MTLLLRKLRLLWVRYLVPMSLERDLLFRATMDALTRRGLRVAGALGLIGVVLYLLGHLIAGKAMVWGFAGIDPGTRVVLWDKVLIAGLSLILLVIARVRPRVRIGRTVMGLFLLLTAWALVLEGVARGDFTFTAGWLALIMLVTVGTVPFQPWQTAMLCLGIAGLYLGYAIQPSAAAPAGVSVSRMIFLGLVTFLCTTMSASLYVSRYEQYRALRRVARLKEYLSARSGALEQALVRERGMQEQLVQKEKLASLGQLTAGIAHEIKNPLNFVNNFAQLSQELMDELSEELTEDPTRPVGEALADVADLVSDLRANTSKIAEHGMRADGIVKSMLAHSRTSPGEKRSVDVNKLLNEYVGLAYHGMRAQHSGFNVEFERDLDEELSPIPMVPEEIGRVFLNLLDNAFDAVRTRAEQDGATYAPKIRVVTRREPDGVAIRIADNGTGIPAAVKERVFEPFFTTKSSGEGTGLGLSLSYEIITQGHGGTMVMETGEGTGTAFVLTLPSVPETSVAHEDPVEDAAPRIHG
ncbi:MAG: GHKL domain-containing protein [Rhodothermaceae bacterium]|nr:GHKL domain-containing protein [Rhodothermaceae bacterium]